MKRYIALLRGINISGKNKVPMAKLRKCFETLDFMEVKTCLNSGNVIFSCKNTEAAELANRIERMIQHQFSLNIPVFVIPQEELADILRHTPDWWGTENQEIYDRSKISPKLLLRNIPHTHIKRNCTMLRNYRTLSAALWQIYVFSAYSN